MKMWRQYFQEQSIVGFSNYMEDRMRIMSIYKVQMNECFNKSKKTKNKNQRLLNLYQCEIPIIENTIQRIRSASGKCENSQFPERCQEFYNQLIPRLEYKIKFNNAQSVTLNRKLGILNYD